MTVKQAVSEVSSKRVLLSDSSKYNRIATFLALPLERFDVVVTDKKRSDAGRELLSVGSWELVLAS